ncbi:hypothetical protein HCN51_10800 [Nonomuraea sp. FMUSA5-5]|uniref:Uncharacterized protein n=1 Tax=Nonomuraea composti TaxID=2720023 RepID=A0ABX1B2I8_9ACTN|nr:hypothetical protein [Nonomuraea sp. FMUSA5-5]NJP89929.1 hypothetical protein [Nonomuraea sp. FMUSA5-5]
MTSSSRLLADLARAGNIAALRQALPPWSALLPEADVEAMLGELVDTARAAATPETLALLLAQWRHSAEIHADPALHAVLTREPEGDLGAVPRPAGQPYTER